MRPQDYARSLFKFVDIEVAPIRLEPVLEAERVELREEEFVNIDGLSFKEPEKRLIIVNSLLPPERKRFVIAHELAHIIMPHKEPYHICRQNKESRMERDANRFAAELLMPESLMKSLWKRYKDNTEYRVSVMAERFCVSPTSMAIRIRQLRLK